MCSWNNSDFTPYRTNFGWFSAVGSDAFVKNHCTHNFLFCCFKFFCNKVNAGFFNHLSDCMIFRQCFDFFFNEFFSFFKFFLSVSSIEVMISINNHIMSCFVDDIFNFSSVIRVYKFFSYNAALFCKFNLCITLFSDFTLSKFYSSHNIVFCNEFTSGFNHDNAVMCTCNNNIQIRFCCLLVGWVSNEVSAFIS